MSPAVISVRGLVKRFPGTLALDHVDLDVRPGEVVGLIGQNGSGKSTLLKILSGLQAPDAGTISLRGKPVHLGSPLVAEAHGIGMVHQEQSLLPNLSVAENLFLGRASAATRHGWYKWDRLHAEARAQFAKIDLVIPPEAIVEDLSFADRQMVELVKVLALEERTADPVVVLFDEPTSVLGAAEIETLFRQIRRLRERSSVVFVSHRMDEVLAVSDRVYVLSNGRCMAERAAGNTDPEELYRLMVGKDADADTYVEHERVAAGAAAPVRLRVEGLAAPGSFKEVSFELRRGETLALAGVAGSGAEAVCRALFGAEPTSAGDVQLDGEPVVLRSPADAVALGIGYVPAERKSEGIVQGRSIHENMVLAFGPDLGRGGLLDRRREKREVAAWMQRLKVKAPSSAERIDALSGGNQQKVVLGRWLLSERLRVLILDHPTRGLDPGAKADLYRTMRDLARGGLAIVLVADTLEETLGLADQVLVLRDGVITRRFDDLGQCKPPPEAIVEAMV